MNFVYEVRQNSDLMEGKGRMDVKGNFQTEDAALVFIESLPVDMGGGKSAEIVRVPVFESSKERKDYNRHNRPGGDRVWGYRKDWRGQWGEGWVDNRDAPVNDPEYAEYMRLKKKFGG